MVGLFCKHFLLKICCLLVMPFHRATTESSNIFECHIGGIPAVTLMSEKPCEIPRDFNDINSLKYPNTVIF